MAIVARGLGLPEDGALVVGGLGVSEADPNAMFATLAGSSSVSATLSTGGASEPDPPQDDQGGRPIPRLFPKPKRLPMLPVPAAMSASIGGFSFVRADLTFTANFDDLDFELLLALDLV